MPGAVRARDLQLQQGAVAVAELPRRHDEAIASTVEVVELDALEHLQIGDARQREVRPEPPGDPGEPLQCQHHRHHHLAGDAVIGEPLVGASAQRRVEREAAGTGGLTHGLGTRLAAVHQLHLRGAAAGELVGEHLRTGVERDQRHAEAGEPGRQLGRDHAAVPRAPAHGLHEQAVPAMSLGQLVEDLVGHGVGALAHVAAAGRHRREHG